MWAVWGLPAALQQVPAILPLRFVPPEAGSMAPCSSLALLIIAQCGY